VDAWSLLAEANHEDGKVRTMEDERPHILPSAFVQHAMALHGRERQQFGVGRRVLLTYVSGVGHVVQDLGLIEAPVRLFRDPLYTDGDASPARWSVMRGPIGAPAACAVVEELVAFGTEELWIVGYAGSLQPELPYGKLLIPDSAYVDEGTSPHYGRTDRSFPSRDLLALLKEAAPDAAVGPVWTTDAIYREMPSQIRRYQGLGVQGVDMEVSALFHLGQHLGIPVAALMVTSDELFHDTGSAAETTWRPGFGSSEVLAACQRAHDLLTSLLTR